MKRTVGGADGAGRWAWIAFTLAASALAYGCASVLGLDAGSALEDGGADGGLGNLDTGATDDRPSVEAGPDGQRTDGSVLPTCATGEHLCGAACARDDNPNFGCGAAACTPCKLAHATAVCSGGACAIGTCATGWDNCDKSEADGCESDLTSAGTCGSCTVACIAPNPLCDGTTCTNTCTSPKVQCGTACADTTNDPNHCGASCTACSPAHSPAACTASFCDHGTCDPGYADCDANRANGCEVSLTGDTTCGSCTMNCTTPSGGHTVALCGAGPACVPSACESGWYDCDGSFADGCECSGAGCCTAIDGGTTDSGPVCQPPHALCATSKPTCCGACNGAIVPFSPSPEWSEAQRSETLLGERPDRLFRSGLESNGNGTCCASPGQACTDLSDCCPPLTCNASSKCQ